MLDYKLMTKHVTKLDVTDRDNITFELCVAKNDTTLARHQLYCILRRRVSGFNVRVELVINNKVYHSTTLYDKASKEIPLVALHNDLMHLDSRERDHDREQYFEGIDAAQEDMVKYHAEH